MGATATQLSTSISNGAAYTYALDEVINPVAIRITFTQQGGTSSGYCVGLYEVECMTYAASMEYNTSADLSAITVDGTAIDGFAADTLAYEIEAGTVAAATDVNAGITVLPAYEGVVRILTIAEDGSAAKTYAVTLTEDVCAHSDTELQNASAATCTAAGYTGDTYCNDCQTVVETGTAIPATGHQHTEVRDASAATCTAAGYTGDTYCTDCGALVSTGSTIGMKDHAWDNGTVTKEATETENGIKTYTCTDCGTTKTEEIVYQITLKAPTVSLEVSTNSSGRIVITGTVDDYENLDEYYEITGHGIVYINSSRLGGRILTLSTAGRTRVNFSSYSDEGSFTYNMKPTSKTTSYTMAAFLIYTNTETGKSITVYSDSIRGSYNSLK